MTKSGVDIITHFGTKLSCNGTTTRGYTLADVQPENGCLTIAHDLVNAMLRHGLNALEWAVMVAVMELTYGSGKTKSQISSTDIRYMLGAESKIRTDRIQITVEKLINDRLLFSQTINQHNQILGVQKDFDKWGGTSLKSDKMSHTINRSITLNSKTGTSIALDNLSPLIEYAHKNTDFVYGVGTWRAERKAAKLLYTEALTLARSPLEAALAIRDYIDELNSQEWFKGCKMRLVYMSSRFKQWYKSLPAKPRNIKFDEEITGYTYRYSTAEKGWVPRA